nr:DNA-directed RNA polymerase subunit beta [Clostridia bacterium]
MKELRTIPIGKKSRKTFSVTQDVMEMPNLVAVQKDSYNWFLERGLNEVLRDVGKISDYTGKISLEFVGFRLSDETNYTIAECKKRDATYSKRLYVKGRLRTSEPDAVKDEDIYFGDFPVMTEGGTFVINGAERVIISQLVRSPGCYYLMQRDKTGRGLFKSTIIPNRGAWLEYETDPNNMFFVRIDKTRRIPVTTLIKALHVFSSEETAGIDVYRPVVHLPSSSGATFGSDDAVEAYPFIDLNLGENDDIIRLFGASPLIEATLEKDETKNYADAIFSVYRKLRPGEPPTMDTARQQMQNLFFDDRRYDISKVGRYKYNKKLGFIDRIRGCILAPADPENPDMPYVSAMTGELLTLPDGSPVGNGTAVDVEVAKLIEQAGISRINVWAGETPVTVISNGMLDAAEYLPEFSAAELSELGIDEKVCAAALKVILDNCSGKKELRRAIELNKSVLVPAHITVDDIIASVNYILCLYASIDANDASIGRIDDIDHLGNRRIRSVGELLANQFRIGFARLERVVHDKMTLQAQDPAGITPRGLVNIRPVVAVIKEFFGSSQLSQFMDQTNPLAELTSKRRISALGPGGLSRERAGFEVRDVHYSHYGRMCPIETPEGPNIGLISCLSTYARVNKYGFVEAPYRYVDKSTGIVSKKIRYMTADEEDEYIIAQANEPLDRRNRFKNAKVLARRRDEFIEVEPDKVDYMDISPLMVVSAATAMIPFLEHDDAHRALMGSNMQRQAVPLLTTESPIVGTGMEHKAAIDSRSALVADYSGTVVKVSADTICIARDGAGTIDEYNLIKFLRSNQGTCINQRPIVSTGEHVEAGEVIADGPSTNEGEISLGRNMLIGFMTWEGYNYEDAVLLNERLVRDDTFTSIHIEKYECEARDTKLGPEDITRDIPNVGDDALKDLTEDGIIRIGAEVRAGDILVGKVTPKGETELTAEERLLRAIFGEKAKEVRDTSLKVPHGEYGIVVDVEVLSREDKTGEELSPGVNKVVRCYIAQKRKISVGDKMAGRHGNKGVVSRILPEEDMPYLSDGTPLDVVLNPLGVPSRMNVGQVLEVHLSKALLELGYKISTPVFDGASEKDIRELLYESGHGLLSKAFDGAVEDKKNDISIWKNNEQALLEKAREPGVENDERARLFDLAGKYNEQSKACAVLWSELEAFSEELHEKAAKKTGYAEKRAEFDSNPDKAGEQKLEDELEVCYESLLFDACAKIVRSEAKDERSRFIQELIKREGFMNDNGEIDGKTLLHDGRTGRLFDNRVTVGIMYFLKLLHLVDDKIHARSTG